MIPEQLRAFVSDQIDRLQATYPPNRVVALLLVVLGAPAAAIGGYLATWVPSHFAGVPAFTSGQYTSFFLTGAGVVALSAITMAYRFIDGVQKDEQHVTALANESAARDHAGHMEALRLESAERVALVEKADNVDHAVELLGIPGLPTPEVAKGSPAEAVGATLPPIPGQPLPPLPMDTPPPQEAGEDVAASKPIGEVEPATPPPSFNAPVPPPDQV